MSLLDRIREVNQADVTAFSPFVVQDRAVGWVGPALRSELAARSELFAVSADRVSFAAGLARADAAQRSRALAPFLVELRERGWISGWRDEQYGVYPEWGGDEVFRLERAAAPLFGVTGFGVHVNGFVRGGADLGLWVATRSQTKPTDPGKLDQIVAGGQPAGLTLIDNVAKECFEEAGIPENLAGTARATGTVTYAMSTAERFRPDVLFVFDLELPRDFIPVNTDGEVERFELWPVEHVLEVVRDTRRFKFNCALVVIDFLVRHGVISPETPDYEQIVAGLRGRHTFLRTVRLPPGVTV